LSVTLIALLQFSKAAFLVIIAMFLWRSPATLHGSNDVGPLVYIAADGFCLPMLALWPAILIATVFDAHPDAYSFVLLVPALAIYPAVVGWGLWHVRKWAHKTLIATSMLALWFVLDGFTVEWTMLQAVLHKYAIATGSKRQAVCALLLIDGTVLFYLCLGDGVRKAFGVKD
jgi:hypothetical protein